MRCARKDPYIFLRSVRPQLSTSLLNVCELTSLLVSFCLELLTEVDDDITEWLAQDDLEEDVDGE